jgi:glycyl-radical enzyme activating protein/glucokinase-like ROK family protein
MDDWVLGVDLGGTKIEVGLVDPHNRIVGRRRIPTNAFEGPQRVVERIADCEAELRTLLPVDTQIAALGICSPGPVDHETGTLIDPPNLAGLHNAPLRQMLAERLNLVVTLEHDAKATALGEFYYGAGRDETSMVFIIAGTGVGGAIIVDGQLVRGKYNSAGEVGHITLDRNGDLCSCGSRGCVETFIAGPWLAKRYLQARQNWPDLQGVTGEQVSALASRGDDVALKVMGEAGEALGIAIASLAMILNIDLFVIGGSVVKAGDLLLEPARRALPRHSYRSVGCGIQIVATELGDDGPILGCAWLARQALGEVGRKNPSFKLQRSAASERERLEKVEGVVFDIQRFSVHDGPGIRTNVFLKGCPLRCPWCANPEGQRLMPELMLSAQHCMNCQQFTEPCTVSWAIDGQYQTAHDKYSQRASVCPTRAIRWAGERRAAGDVMAEVMRDVPFYGDDGGMTLTGGEPTFQPRMAEALLRLAKENGISTALETTGYTRWKVLERVLPYTDHILYDVKHLDAGRHRAVTGVDNELILSNLRKLAALGAPVSVRVPLIPDFNASDEDLGLIAEFVAHLGGLAKTICLLPYHTLGRGKYQALGRAYPWNGHKGLSDEVTRLADVVRSYGLTVTVGG